MTMTLIETKTLGATANAIEFTSIPQDGTDLLVLYSVRTTNSGTTGVYISFNGSTSSFSSRYLDGNGASVSTGTLARYAGNAVDASATSNTFANIATMIPNYTGSTNKSYSTDSVTENNGTTAYQDLVAGLWSNTAAITSLAIASSPGDLVAGSTISLYKITKGSSGGVVVS
jgi:hypothetical protein